jgi:hypothetical protein
MGSITASVSWSSVQNSRLLVITSATLAVLMRYLALAEEGYR